MQTTHISHLGMPVNVIVHQGGGHPAMAAAHNRPVHAIQYRGTGASALMLFINSSRIIAISPVHIKLIADQTANQMTCSKQQPCPIDQQSY